MEFSNWAITVVSKHDIRTYWNYIFIFPDDDLPPLENETRNINSRREESEEVNSRHEEIRKEIGFKDKVEKKIIRTLKHSLRHLLKV